MMCILRPNQNDIPEWELYDEQWLLTRYSGELSRQSVLEQIWADFGEDIAVSIGYGE